MRLTAASLFVFALGAASGQAPSHGTLHWDARSTPLPARPGLSTFQINLTVPNGRRWLLGCVFDGSVTPEIRAADVKFQTAPPMALSISDVPAVDVRVSAEGANVSLTGPGTLAVYIALPPEVTIAVSVNDKEAFRGQQQGSLFLDTGIVAPGALTGVSSFFRILALGAKFPVPNVTQRHDGTFTANWQAVLTHIVSPPPSSRASQEPCCDHPENAFSLSVTVGPLGSVESATARVDNPASAQAIEAARHWMFRPFLYEGSPVPVSFKVAVLVDSHGNPRLPVFTAR